MQQCSFRACCSVALEHAADEQHLMLQVSANHTSAAKETYKLCNSDILVLKIIIVLVFI